MTTGFGGNVRHDPPYAERRFRHRETGELALLTVRIYWPYGQEVHVLAPSAEVELAAIGVLAAFALGRG